VKEISNSMVLGILGVILTFFLHFWFTYLWLDIFGISIQTHEMTLNEGSFEFDIQNLDFDKHYFSVSQLMIIAAIFSSIDLLAVMPQVPEETYPKIS
jgi:hypothetical protein